jgi:preprotein translocase subunit SecF
VNQTVVRSINTSVIALLPVGSILFIGTWFLGAGVLKDLALALFVGIAVGTYSSIFIATPLLAQMKEREPQMKALARRVAARQTAGRAPAATATPAVATAGAPVAAAATPSRSGSSGSRPMPRQQRSGSKSKRRPSGKKRR